MKRLVQAAALLLALVAVPLALLSCDSRSPAQPGRSKVTYSSNAAAVLQLAIVREVGGAPAGTKALNGDVDPTPLSGGAATAYGANDNAFTTPRSSGSDPVAAQRVVVAATFSASEAGAAPSTVGSLYAWEPTAGLWFPVSVGFPVVYGHETFVSMPAAQVGGTYAFVPSTASGAANGLYSFFVGFDYSSSLNQNNGRGVPCSGSTYADAGAGVQVQFADAGLAAAPNFGCRVSALSSNSSSIFVGCNPLTNATPGSPYMGTELTPGQRDVWPSPCLPYVASDAGSQSFGCECFGQ